MNFKLIKSIIIITIIILTLILFAVIWGAYDNLKSVRASTGELNKGIDVVVIEWTSDYAKDTALLEQIDKDLAESEAKLDKMFKEAEAIIGD